jgi:ankyrin repeat protein
MSSARGPREAFLEAATWHGNLDAAEQLLAEHPDVASSDLATAAVAGDAPRVAHFVDRDPASVAARCEPYGATALVYLCLSRYLRLDPARSAGFLEAARRLLDAGADPNAGFWSKGEVPEFETALYGAAGVAHHAELTRLLVERGADPNDEEVAYHSPEGYDVGALQALVETGRITPVNLGVMLCRKHDWHDREGVSYLLRRGADPNLVGRWGRSALHQAILRNNSLEIIELLLEHGADPFVKSRGDSAIVQAAWAGRGDLLDLFERRGFPTALEGVDRLVADCARGAGDAVRALGKSQPGLVRDVIVKGGQLLAEFAGVGNAEGLRCLIELGVSVDALFEEGDGYWDLAPRSTALHVAAWRARPAAVKLLIDRGAKVDATDGQGRRPIELAVKACVNSYWKDRRTPECVELLLKAGASARGVRLPTGYDEADALLRRHGGT